MRCRGRGMVTDDRLKPFLYVVRTPQQVGHADIASDDAENRQDHERYRHDLRRFVDMMLHLF